MLQCAARPEITVFKSSNEALEQLASREYPYGFVTDIEAETIPPGLDENVVRLISAKRRARS